MKPDPCPLVGDYCRKVAMCTLNSHKRLKCVMSRGVIKSQKFLQQTACVFTGSKKIHGSMIACGGVKIQMESKYRINLHLGKCWKI